MSKMTLEGGIFLVTNIKLVGGKERKTDKADPKDYHPEMVAAAPAGANVTANVTVQRMDDPAEYARAEGVREAVRKMLGDVATTQTPLGLMASHSDQEKLDQAIADARAAVETYNATAKRTFITPWIVQMALRADESTLKQVATEVKDLLAAMDAGIQKRDAEAIREAARRAKMYAEMMDEAHGEIVIAAIEEARRHAKEVAKAVKERGDAALTEVLACDSAARKAALNAARAAFLDVEGDAVEIVPIAVQAARALDVESDPPAAESPIVEKVGVEELPETPDFPVASEENADDPDASRAVDKDAAEFSKAAGAEGGEAIDVG